MVYLQDNPLSEDSINTYMSALQARGVTIHHQNTGSCAKAIVHL